MSEERHHASHGLSSGGLHLRDCHEWYFAQGAHWPPPGPQDTRQQLRRLPAALSHVHVRIGVVSDENVRERYHRRTQIGMEVKRRGDRDRRSQHLANRCEHMGVRVLHAFGDRRAVQHHEHAIHRAGSAQARLKLPAKRFQRVTSDRPRGNGTGVDRRHQLEPEFVRRRDHAAQLSVRARVPG